MGIQAYRDLMVWQKAMRLAAEAYRLGRLLPKAEEYRLTSQLLRSETGRMLNGLLARLRDTTGDPKLSLKPEPDPRNLIPET